MSARVKGKMKSKKIIIQVPNDGTVTLDPNDSVAYLKDEISRFKKIVENLKCENKELNE